MRCLREQFGAPAETSSPGPHCQRKESGKRVEKTEKDVNSKNQPCKHHQSIFIHFLTASILPPAFLFGRSPLQGVEDLDLEQATLRAKSLASGGQQLSGMRVISCDSCDVWNGSRSGMTWKWDKICLSCIMPTRGDREPSSGSFHGAMCRLLKA